MRIQGGQILSTSQRNLVIQSINITMDRYGHCLTIWVSLDQQVELLEDSFLSVRKSLEEGNKKGLEAFAVNS